MGFTPAHLAQTGYYYMDTYPNDTTLGTTSDYRTFHSARGPMGGLPMAGVPLGGVPFGALAPAPAMAPFY